MNENVLKAKETELKESQVTLEKNQTSIKNFKKNIILTLILFVGLPAITPTIVSPILGISERLAAPELSSGLPLITVTTVFLVAYTSTLIALPIVVGLCVNRKIKQKKMANIQNQINSLTKELAYEKDKIRNNIIKTDMFIKKEVKVISQQTQTESKVLKLKKL